MNKKVKYILLGLLLISFSILLWSILNGKIVSFDSTIYNLVTFNMSDTVTTIYKVITFFGSTVFIVSLVIFFLVILFKNKRGIIIAICLIVSTILNNVIKVIIKRERPLDLMLVEESTYSFPSGHTMASVSLYGLLIYLIWQTKWHKNIKILLTSFLSILIIAIGLSRIYLGAHYASDVIGSVIVSTIWLIILIDFIKNKKLI